MVNAFGCDGVAAALNLDTLIHLSRHLDAATRDSITRHAAEKAILKGSHGEQLPLANLNDLYDLIAGGSGDADPFLLLVRSTSTSHADHVALVLRASSAPSTATTPLARALAERSLSPADAEHVTKVAPLLLNMHDQNIAQTFTNSVISGAKNFSDPLLPAVLHAVRGASRGEHYRRLARHRLSLLPQTDVPPAFSWHQPHAALPEHPLVQAFLRGRKPDLVVTGLDGIREARDLRACFRTKGKYDPNLRCSVIASERGKGSNASCYIAKTRDYFERVLRCWRVRRDEAVRLIHELDGGEGDLGQGILQM
ncbi:hypothetical protein BDK51DRAFT_33351 [Blyttiomyces helicus]|uniref:Uncharacterized protein n=1 Tax=Blyttiomyces helicus TaxID=388810 RepID=A0A4V1IR77_9FUNG|nr:hypothetical protein BDK51DRAFT_33351 [Blyttiomyces helicus]|eukprot:RKO89097.1 hypothetical protein BDK51DRAFT_33351 [Blyttiomyces helicus]